MKITLKQLITKLNSQELYPEILNKTQVEILKKEYGINWMGDLGYSNPFYHEPVFIHFDE